MAGTARPNSALIFTDQHRKHYPVQNSTLSAGSLATDLSRLYSLGRSVDCVFFRKGICDTYRVCACNARFFLKVYRRGRRSRLDVEEEVRLLLHLAHDGVSVAAPVPRNDNAYVTAFDAPEGTRFAVLFDAAKGELDDGGDLTRVTALGRMVGRMHRSLDSFPLPYRRRKLDLAHLINENMEAISQLMSHRQQDLRLIGSVGDDIKRLSLFSTTMAPEFGPCHGDLHGGDVAYDSDGNPTVFDFDSSGCGWRAYDVGIFPASVQWMDVSEATEMARQQRLTSFLEGYRENRGLSSDELDVVQASPAIRHIFLMGHVLKFTTVTEGYHWATDDFIDWHMQWFRDWGRRTDSE